MRLVNLTLDNNRARLAQSVDPVAHRADAITPVRSSHRTCDPLPVDHYRHASQRFSEEIKLLDGCAVNGHVWVFGASTSDLGYTIRVTDTATGAVTEYRNQPGMPAAAIADSTAFGESCDLP